MKEIKEIIKEMQAEQDRAFEAYDFPVSNTLEYFVRQLNNAVGSESYQTLAERILEAIEEGQRIGKSEYTREDMLSDIESIVGNKSLDKRT